MRKNIQIAYCGHTHKPMHARTRFKRSDYFPVHGNQFKRGYLSTAYLIFKLTCSSPQGRHAAKSQDGGLCATMVMCYVLCGPVIMRVIDIKDWPSDKVIDQENSKNFM